MPDLTVIESDPPNASVIAALERVLERARAGEVSAVAIASVFRDGSAGQTWSDLPRTASMIGAISRMAYLLHREQDE